MAIELSNEERLGLICGAMAAFASAPTPSRKTDLTKALGEYQQAWIERHDPTADQNNPFVRDEHVRIVPALRLIREAIVDQDPQAAGTLGRLVVATKEWPDGVTGISVGGIDVRGEVDPDTGEVQVQVAEAQVQEPNA